MSTLILFMGAGIGAVLVAGASFVLRGRASRPAWRGYLNAIGTGIALGAMVDLMPAALDMATALVQRGLQILVLVPMNAATNSPLDLAALLVTDLVRPLGGVFILLLYLSANSLPIVIKGRLVGKPAWGWRAWLAIPAAGETDWKGTGLLCCALAAQNLWVAQVRGALVTPGSRTLTIFLVLISVIGALRALALLGALATCARRWLWIPALTLIIATPVAIGVWQPGGRETIAFGLLPPLLATLVVPIVLGRLLRSIQADIGMGWRTTATVLAALVLTRLLDSLILMAAQGSVG